MEREFSVKELTFQVLSDIHLEYRVTYEPPITAPILILAGDIGRPQKSTYIEFITWVSKKYDYVIIITGNHEYYNSSIEEIDEEMKKLEKKFFNIIVLQNETIVLSCKDRKVRVYGGTLWSDVSSNPYISELINDYTKIKNFTPDVSTALHRKMVEKIEHTVLRTAYLIPSATSSELPLIIITHHLPSYKFIHKDFMYDDSNCAFASNLDHLIEKCILWVHGHSHRPHRTKIGNTLIVANTVGYPYERIKISHDPINIDSL